MRLVVILAAVLGIWLQAMPTATEAIAAPQLAGLATLCGHATQDRSSPVPGAHDHRHCLLCQAGWSAAILPPQPHAPLLAQAVAASVAVEHEVAANAAFHAYASRAPPEIG